MTTSSRPPSGLMTDGEAKKLREDWEKRKSSNPPPDDDREPPPDPVFPDTDWETTMAEFEGPSLKSPPRSPAVAPFTNEHPTPSSSNRIP